MIRGTTPTHIFQLPIPVATIDQLRITYAQGSNVVLEKTEADVSKTGKTVRYTLTQEESLLFEAGPAVNVQVRVLTTDGTAMASGIKRLNVNEVLNEEVLG